MPSDESVERGRHPFQYVVLVLGIAFTIAFGYFMMVLVWNVVSGDILVTEKNIQLIKAAAGSGVVSLAALVAQQKMERGINV